MVSEISNNRLEEDDGILKQRLRQKVIDPLAALVEEVIPVAALELDSARRILEKNARNESMRIASQFQVTALEAMKEVLIHMVRNEGYQQAVNLLYEIQREQERMNKMTSKAKEIGMENTNFSNSSGTSTTINWQCSDDQLTTILYEIRAQRFKPGYSPTYVGVVFSGSGANNSSQSQTISSLDPEYIYEFNVQCKDTAGSYREPQIQLGCIVIILDPYIIFINVLH